MQHCRGVMHAPPQLLPETTAAAGPLRRRRRVRAALDTVLQQRACSGRAALQAWLYIFCPGAVQRVFATEVLELADQRRRWRRGPRRGVRTKLAERHVARPVRARGRAGDADRAGGRRRALAQVYRRDLIDFRESLGSVASGADTRQVHMRELHADSAGIEAGLERARIRAGGCDDRVHAERHGRAGRRPAERMAVFRHGRGRKRPGGS